MHGWTVIAVFPTRADPGPLFAYTVGLSGKGLPELVIYGLPGPVARRLLNEVARRMVAAKEPFRGGDEILGVLADELPLVAVGIEDGGDLNLVRELYGAPEAVQLVWPDGDGVFPWEAGAQVVSAEQPVRGRAPEARPLYRARRVSVVNAQELADYIRERPRRSLRCGDGGHPRDDNDIRAEWAARALVAYAEHLGGASLTEEIEVAATDLLGDLRHLFDALGADLEVAVEVSRVHYRAEIRGTL